MLVYLNVISWKENTRARKNEKSWFSDKLSSGRFLEITESN